ncbi:hypothetical protein DFA_08575 [Cavenderia fasciculata]|uniref:Uncharacterized protein n=1 Tax=Cavenderia fasciculata TaxID=261658 RepID=F4Q315_CACFS|nr:uncharacterized protein DFA_08575 [Cavenderia fasciculata]EGG17579.1 hypothetical protein DFA_08575 [Cavenderia fasciculata]|eukprot:XP_004356063.1 hypothetical protein DFA_08575 [Cavenderia fasciculata]
MSIPFNFQLPLNHSTTDNHILLDVQSNSNKTTNPISFFDHQPIISININNNNNNISFFNDHQSSIPCFNSSNILTHCQSNNLTILTNPSTLHIHLQSINNHQTIGQSSNNNSINKNKTTKTNNNNNTRPKNNNNNNNYSSYIDKQPIHSLSTINHPSIHHSLYIYPPSIYTPSTPSSIHHPSIHHPYPSSIHPSTIHLSTIHSCINPTIHYPSILYPTIHHSSILYPTILCSSIRHPSFIIFHLPIVYPLSIYPSIHHHFPSSHCKSAFHLSIHLSIHPLSTNHPSSIQVINMFIYLKIETVSDINRFIQ